VFKTFFVLVSTGKVIAEAGSMTSDLAKSSTAVASVFEILDRQSLIPKVLYPKLNIIATKLHTWSFEFGFFHIDP
jgi:ATP-binding cassette subfamily B (MDR/TAP) protein 1